DLALDHAFAGPIARHGTADEIVRRGVADVLDDGGIDIAQIDEAAGQGLGVSGRSEGDDSESSQDWLHDLYPLRHGRACPGHDDRGFWRAFFGNPFTLPANRRGITFSRGFHPCPAR